MSVPRYQFERGRLRGFDGFWDLSQELCRTVPGDDSESVQSGINFFLGLVHSLTNDIETSWKHREAFYHTQSSLCQSIGPDFVDGRLRIACGEMGIAYTATGQYDLAIQMFRRESEIRRQIGITYVVGGDANHALALMLKGDLEDADRLLIDRVELWKSTGSVMSLR